MKTKVLMLSATPVNNRFNDLRNQLALAYEGDSENLSKKLRTGKDVEEIFRRAQAAFNDWSKLPPEERTATRHPRRAGLRLLRAARQRHHCPLPQAHPDLLRHQGHRPLPRAPQAALVPLPADRTAPMCIGFNEIFEQLSLLKLAVYAPVSYILPSRLKKYEELYDTEVEGGKGKFRQADREKSLQALMTVNLLKRLESSVEAFRLTLQIAARQPSRRRWPRSTAFKKTGQRRQRLRTLTDVSKTSKPRTTNLPVPTTIDASAARSRSAWPTWTCRPGSTTCERDLAVIDALAGRDAQDHARATTPSSSTSRRMILEQARDPDQPRQQKVLIFTAFADTANYLYDNLAPSSCAAHRPAHRQGHRQGCAEIHARARATTSSRCSRCSRRAPRKRPSILPERAGEIDLLIGTDCISEGQNLQDCDYLINYDIHWNPVRIIQRFGRIDRIGSHNTSIQLVNYWPDISLDEYINLKERVENRMMIADVTATGDDNVLTAKANDVSYRKEQLRRLQEEVIELEDLKTGVSITDLGLNDFRMDLLNYVKANGDLAQRPQRHACRRPRQPERGLRPA